ncbi:MAG: polyprenol monophosphomannose synthase [Chloroflexota bacterium]
MNLPLIFIVIPTYNEANNLTQLATQLMNLPLKRLHLLIVDDNSPDGTGHVADALQECLKGIHVLHRARKSGLGSAYLDGFRYALAYGADYVIQMDADFSHSPQHIPQMIRRARKYDVVVGSRYVTGGTVDPRWSWWRHGLSRWANQIYVRAILGLDVADATAGFKCWSRPALEAVLRQPISSSGYIFQVEMAYLAQKLALRVLETPIYFEDRRIGQSKMSWSVKIEAVWRTWILRWRHAQLQPESPEPEVALPAKSTAVSQFKLKES